MPSRRSKLKQANQRTLGGAKLQELRRATGLSLLELVAVLESDHGKPIDAGHINKIETGSIKKPTAGTLETILAGLQANYREQRDVLEAFGYKVVMSLPTEQEVAEAIQLSASEVHDSTTHPVFFVDFSQRLWAWNRYAPRLIGLHPDDPATARFIGVTLFDITFNPAYETGLLIDNPDEYLPALVQSIKAGMYAFCEEPWYQELIAKASTFPGFRPLWDNMPASVLERIPPIKIRLPESGLLQFRISNSELVQDPRFRMIHFTPYGATTLRACAEWAEEESIL